MNKQLTKQLLFILLFIFSKSVSAINVNDSTQNKQTTKIDSVLNNTPTSKNSISTADSVIYKKTQRRTKQKHLTDWEKAVVYLNKYVANEHLSKYNKKIQQQIQHYLQLLENKQILNSIKEAKLYLNDIKIVELEKEIKQFVDSLQQQKNDYNIYREAKSVLGDSLILYSDKEGISSADENFKDLLDYLSDPDSVKDAQKKKKEEIERHWQTNYLSDTLIYYVKNMVTHLHDDSIFIWLKEQQNDTLDLYITNINNDSIPIRLYENSNQLIPIKISDFWGRDVSAVIRDINSKSFKILIDDTPYLNNSNSGEKAKHMLKNQYGVYDDFYNLKLNTLDVPNILSPWRFYGNVSLDGTQILLHQWNKGGQSSLAILANAELYLKYKNGKHNLNSYAKFKLGFIRQGDYSDNKAFFETNNDIIDIQAKYGYQIQNKPMHFTLFSNFKTQFAPAYDYPSDTQKVMVSKFFNPAQITFAIGLNYKQKKYNVFISPISAKTTIINNPKIDVTKYGLEKGDKSRSEIGAIFKGNIKNKIWGNIVMENTLELFSNYLYKPQNVDIIWDMKITFPINDYIKTTLSTSFAYNDDEKVTKKHKDRTTYQSKGGQFRQMLMIGFYTFF